MELIIHNNQIDVSNIQFKRGKNNMKLLYKLQSVFMIGICLELKPTFIIKEYCPERIEIKDEKQLVINEYLVFTLGILAASTVFIFHVFNK